MTDVEMPDAGPSTQAQSTSAHKEESKSGNTETALEVRKRFEVKKVGHESGRFLQMGG